MKTHIISTISALILFYSYGCSQSDNTDNEIKKIELSPATLNMTEGQTFRLSVLHYPQNVTDHKYSFTSLNNQIASISSDGLVTAIKEGQTTISVTSLTDQTLSAASIINIKKAEPIKSITLNRNILKLPISEISHLTATITPYNANPKRIKWKSSDTNVAIIDSNGIVTSQNTGNASITAYNNDNEIEATCEITVCNINEAVIISGESIYEIVPTGKLQGYFKTTIDTNSDLKIKISDITIYNSKNEIRYHNSSIINTNKHTISIKEGPETILVEQYIGWKISIKYQWNNEQYSQSYTTKSIYVK